MANTNIYELTDEWTDSGTDYDGIALDVTDTASSATSYLMRLSKNATNVFSLRKDGLLTLAGVIVAAGLTLTALASTDIPLVVKGAASQSASLQEWRNNAGTVLANISASGVMTVNSVTINSDGTPTTLTTNGGWFSSTLALRHSINIAIGNSNGFPTGISHSLHLINTGAVGWSSDGTYYGTKDLVLCKDAADILALRRLTNAQALRVYNTYTDTSNYERLNIAWSSSICSIYTSSAGTGGARKLQVFGNTQLELGAGFSVQWQISTSGHFLALTDNTYDIGASGATRPRNVYVAGTVTAGAIVTGSLSVSSGTSSINQISITAANALLWAGRARIRSSADGVLELLNSAETDFGRLNFGGTTSSFPALKRDGAGFSAVLADNSAATWINAQTFRVYNTGDSSSGEWVSLRYSGNIAQLTTGAAGAGTLRAFQFGTGASPQWQVSTAGHLLSAPGTDNAYDIGASGATRPRNVYVAGTVTAGALVTGTLSVSSGTSSINQISITAANALLWDGRARMRSSADGVLDLLNSAETDFGRMNFGGATSSFPAIKRSTTQLHIKLADDSAFAELLFKLPTSDPGVSGVLWNNGGTVAISA